MTQITNFATKLQMLMTRLSLLKQLQCSVFNSWLEHLRDYFEEFLSEQIDMIGPLQDDCLDSPFASWSSEGKIKALHSLHIRRQAIFLFLRCSLVLINLEEATANQCCAVTKLQLDFDLRCCNHKNGLVQLCQWLRNNLPAFNFSKSGLYWRKCLYFTSSFLKLFMNEVYTLGFEKFHVSTLSKVYIIIKKTSASILKSLYID